MVSYKKKIRKKLKHRTLKYMNGGGLIVPSPFMIVMKSIKNMMYYSLMSLASLPVYITAVALNLPLASMRNVTNGRFKDTQLKDSPFYKLASKQMDPNTINLFENKQKQGELIMPLGTTFKNGVMYKGHLKGMIPQKEQSGGAYPSVGLLKTMIPSKIPSVGSLKTMIPSKIPSVGSLKTMIPANSTTIISNPLENVVSTINSNPSTNTDFVNSKSTTLQMLNNKTIKRDPEQIKKIKEYYKKRTTYKNKNRETIINALKSNLLPNSQKSIEVFGREYDISGKNTMDTIYRIEMLDSERIEDENSILKKAMNKLSSDVLLKAIILFNTVFDISYNSNDVPNDEYSNNICTSYLNKEKEEMGINKLETIPTFWNPIPVVTVKNIFKYKDGLNPLYFGSKTFANCLKSNLTKTEFSKEDMDLCVDLIDQDCPDCTLNSTLTNIIESYGRLLTGKIDISSMINALFNILLKMYKNQINSDSEKKLVTLYLTQIKNSDFNVTAFLEYANYHYVSGMTFNDFIGDIEIKMFKDIMCKYKLREKLFELYKLKKQEENELLKKVSITEREKRIKHDLIKFLGIFLDISQLNSNNHLTIPEIETEIKTILANEINNSKI